MYALLKGKPTPEFLHKISDGKAKWKDSFARLTFLYSLFQRSMYDLSLPTSTHYASLLHVIFFFTDFDRRRILIALTRIPYVN